MPVPTTMTDLSTTAASNSPANSDPVGTSLDDFLRGIQAIIRTTNAKGADIASATTTDIGSATGEFVDVTGTTPITGLGTVAVGIVRTVRFTGALTLTHNATSLILPGGANHTTAANDVYQFRSLGSGNWHCVGYVKASGAAVVAGAVTTSGLTMSTARLLGRTSASTGAIEEISVIGATLSGGVMTISPGALTYLSTVTANGSATADIETTLNSTYDAYLIEAVNVGGSVNDTNLTVYFKQSGTYTIAGYSVYLNGANPPAWATGTGVIAIHSGAGGSASQRGQFTGVVFSPASTAEAKIATFRGGWYSGHSGYTLNAIDSYVCTSDTSAMTGIRFQMSSGNISGTFRLYGINNS